MIISKIYWICKHMFFKKNWKVTGIKLILRQNCKRSIETRRSQKLTEKSSGEKAADRK